MPEGGLHLPDVVGVALPLELRVDALRRDDVVLGLINVTNDVLSDVFNSFFNVPGCQTAPWRTPLGTC